MSTVRIPRRLPAGMELQPGGDAHVRVWAPACGSVEIVLEARGGDEGRRIISLEREDDGYFAAALEDVRAGDRYWFRLDGERLRPDPASRFQPDGPHGASMVVDPSTFAWTDARWPGVTQDGQVIYEMHVGTFTPEGTWAAAAGHLGRLADLGVTVVEMMPVSEFAGRFGWGYDGVCPYAPAHVYGTPDDLRAFVDRAHAGGIGVILDVVYNHLGPDGNYLSEFSPDYFTDKYENDWGQALNFEGPAPARAFFEENGAYWIEEYHFDGLRLDATQDIHDASPEHVIAAIVRRARAAAGTRSVYVVAENEPQQTRLVRGRERGGYGVDALWNDDYHHCALVALTGRREAYYTDYRGAPQELISCARHGFLYQGQWYAWQKQRRGTPALDLPPRAFVAYLENHDQVANTPFGRRLHQLTSLARLRAMTALTLLGSATPMLFQGQEFASSAPFLYFADHKPDLRRAIRDGRREFLTQFPSTADPEVLAALPAPDAEDTFHACKLDHAERERNEAMYVLHRDLLRLRRSDPVIRQAGLNKPDGAVLGPDAFVLRFFGGEADGDRLLLVNLGCDLDSSPRPEPLLAPPSGMHWTLVWTSEAVPYGGQGTPPLRVHSTLYLPGESAVLLKSVRGPIEGDEGHAG
jgi:maltooligosyltrehalose trehalohydrolase